MKKSFLKNLLYISCIAILITCCAPSEKRKIWEISQLPKENVDKKEFIARKLLDKIKFLDMTFVSEDTIILGGVSSTKRRIAVEVQNGLVVIDEPTFYWDLEEELETNGIVKEIESVLRHDNVKIRIKKYRPWTLFG